MTFSLSLSVLEKLTPSPLCEQKPLRRRGESHSEAAPPSRKNFLRQGFSSSIRLAALPRVQLVRLALPLLQLPQGVRARCVSRSRTRVNSSLRWRRLQESLRGPEQNRRR